eukprot:Hpha_TRINITY_DN15231_c1_g8::TRINITY_DN15231_c1_g8_i1::g.67615::m.67615
MPSTSPLLNERDRKAYPSSDVMPGYAAEVRPMTGPLPSKTLRRGSVVAQEAAWDSPAYNVLRDAGLMRMDWRVQSADSLQLRAGNTTPEANCARTCLACVLCPVGGYCVQSLFCKYAEVPAGTVRTLEDGRGGFEFLGKGVHFYCDLFLRLSDHNIPLTGGVHVKNGDRTIVEVEQGYVGFAMDMGQPILLPPGMHQWQSPTMALQGLIDLHLPVIEMGPYTLLTVDKGYDAVTQNNGQQQVLPGGAVHLLNHRNWKFEKFITRKIQTDDLQRINAITGDNVLMVVDATVCWLIHDTQLCAERAAETMKSSHGTVGDIQKLRNDVLKQAEASLSAFVGHVNFSDTFSAATAVASKQTSLSPDDTSMLFNVEKLRDAVIHANSMCHKYGVEVLSINIISAMPADGHLMRALAKGAVSAAEAQQFETAARGKAQAARIESQGIADAMKITARAEAGAEVERAQGSLQAAELLGRSSVAVGLATIQAQGVALKSAKSSLILGAEQNGLGGMLVGDPKTRR